MNLKFLGLYSGQIDGIKGTQTINAIKEFQKDNNLKVDGIAGQKTIDSLRSQIIDIQKQLGVTLDGVAGTETITAFNNKVESLYGKSWDSIKHFKKSEFTCKCGCGLNNIQLDVVKIADEVREHFGNPAIVTSGTRCSKHNKEVGGVANSRHLKGKAIDMYVQNVSWYDLLEYLRKLEQKGKIRYCYHINNSDCCHFDIN
jgi:peptidoglycan hydrolase-like protein with peptidoglycan-binding domain